MPELLPEVLGVADGCSAVEPTKFEQGLRRSFETPESFKEALEAE